MDNIFIIADDLTGAADSGVQFSPFFDDTTLLSYRQLDRILDPTSASATWAAAIYTNSRALTGDLARSRLVSVAQGLARKPSAWIYKKIDSCMRGNVGSEVDALLDELGYDVSFIAPAFPELGRKTDNDIHRVHGVPLAQTEISRDPITPVKESQLSRIVQSQSRYPVDHVALNQLENSDAQLLERINRQLLRGVRHIVFDATERYHLDRIAQLVFSHPAKVLAVGSAGLAGSIAESLSPKRKIAKSAPKFASVGGNLLVCGTVSQVTRRQIDHLLERHPYEFIQLPPEMLTEQNRRNDLAKTVGYARSSLLTKNVILTIVASCNAPTDCRRTISQLSAESIVRGMGIFVADVLAAAKPGNLFLTGGDTADAVLTALEAKGIRILGEIVAGVVHGMIFGGLLDGSAVVTKAGAFGPKDTLNAVHEYWQG